MNQRESSFKQFFERLQHSPFFSELGEDDLLILAKKAKKIDLEAGGVVFEEGAPSQGLYWLESGAVKAVKYARSGKEQILHFIEPGQTFNEVGAFTTRPNPASVMALESCAIWCIPREVIKDQISNNPIFAQMVIDVLSDRLRHSVSLIEDLSLRPVINRLSRLILDQSDDGTLFRPAWYTQYELASRLGTVTDVVQRSLRKLEGEGVIEVERKQIRIIDRVALEHRAE